MNSNYQPTERTSLLNHSQHLESLPSVSETITRIADLDVDSIDDDDLTPLVFRESLEEISTLKVAFVLIILLQLRQKKLHGAAAYGSVHAKWQASKNCQREVNVLEEKIEQIWSDFLMNDRNDSDIQSVLWTSFPSGSVMSTKRQLRVVDFLGNPCDPQYLTSHPVIIMSIIQTWKNGNLLVLSHNPILGRYDATCTPWSMHFLELIFSLFYTLLLVSYILDPPTRPHINADTLQDVGVREILIAVFSVSFLFQPWSFRSVAPFLTLLAFLSCLPSVPFPSDTSFTVLLLCLAILLFQLHTPSLPSPLFLFHPERAIPFAIFLSEGIRKVLLPPVEFFLPVLLFTVYLLSISMTDTLLQPPVAYLLALPSPMETRIAVMLALAFVLLLILLSTFLLATSLPHRELKETDCWNRFSPAVGQAARRAFIRAVAHNSRVYYFPPPFNLVHLLTVKLPSYLGSLVGVQFPFLQKTEKVLWRTLVGPFMVVLALLRKRLGFLGRG